MNLRLLIAYMSSVEISRDKSAFFIWDHWEPSVFYRNKTVCAGIMCQNVNLQFGSI